MTVRELKNAKITHVSYVDKAANKKQFFLTKSADKRPTFQKQVDIITKSEDEQKLVYGVVYEPGVADAHNDFMTAEEIEKAAHEFMKEAQNIDTQHDFTAGAGEIVESYIAPDDLEINGTTIQKGSWVIATKASDEVWEKIKKGEINGYSMAGTAEVEDQEEVSKSEDGIIKSFMKHMGAFFNGHNTAAIEKGEVRDNYARNQQLRNVWAAWDSMESAYYGSRWDNYTNEAVDFDRLLEAIQDFTEIITEIRDGGDVAIAKALEMKPATTLTEEIEKAGRKVSAASMADIETAQTALQNIINRVSDKEEDELKLEDITKAVADAIAPLDERLQKLEKSGEEVPPAAEGNKDDEIVKSVTAAVQKAVEPIEKRLEVIETARGISKQEEKHEEEIQKSNSLWDGVL
ncbi:XkdF-like putative serine protease domain-containing protein (plasmid) [Bacillus anthracis]|uniref:XkdF-like putative serine protease domain-containing protein n=1 Tax=Bacillus anthracis TaxID=1392 RepID=UPI00207AD9BE|nr:XkdF-like putative serine protease domain-containing protein [Bacillus anthracis]USL05477.1 XkdF-like putative serine protease domain-containing protein [Bacillus anthracis]